MSRIRNKNTKPELRVRSTLHKAGYRFRLHRKDLAGTPDIVLPKYRIVIFVHGCFWHRHKNCNYAYTPKSRAAFWEEKFRGNVIRDQMKILSLQQAGWRVLVVWECETFDLQTLSNHLKTLLSPYEPETSLSMKML